MLSKVKENKSFIIVFIIIFIAIIGRLLYYANLKQGFHMDELLTYGLSNSYKDPFPFKYGKWISSFYYHDYLTVNGTDAFAYDSVYFNQAADVHPPLYYIIIHTISSIFQGEFTKWIGLGANVLFFSLTYLSTFIYSNYLLKDKWIALTVASFWGMSVGAVSSVMFIRMYVLLTLWFVLFLYSTTLLLNTNRESYKNYLFILVITVLGTLTQYYFLIGAFFISFVLCLLLFFQKRWRTFFSFAFTMLGGLVIPYILFPPILEHLFNTGRGQEATENMKEGSSHFSEYLQIINQSLFANKGIILVLSALVLLIIAVSVLKLKKVKGQQNISYFFRNAMLLVFPSLFYIIVIQKIAPYQTPRYILAIFPAIIIGLFFILLFSLNTFFKNKMLVRTILLLVTVTWTFMGYRSVPIDNLYSSYENIQNMVEEHKNNDVLIIESSAWRITSNILELKEFNEVFPILLNPNDVQLPESDKHSESERLVVMVDSVFDQELTISRIIEKYDFIQANKLYKYQGMQVYILE